MSDFARPVKRNGAFKRLLAFIPEGEDNAISMYALSSFLGLSERQTRKIVELARLDGNVICSNDSGYFVPETVEELLRYERRVRARIRTAFKTLEPVKALKRTIDFEGEHYFESFY